MSEDTQVIEPEIADNELPPIEVIDMIQHAMDGEYSKANDIFGDVMTIKLNDLLDQEEIRVADQVFNGVDPDEDEQLELDLETEGELESDEEDDSEELEEYEFDEEEFDEEELEN